MSARQSCSLRLITDKNCPICKYVKDSVLPEEDIGVEVLTLDDDDDLTLVKQEYPFVRKLPTLICDCDGNENVDAYEGLGEIKKFVQMVKKDN